MKKVQSIDESRTHREAQVPYAPRTEVDPIVACFNRYEKKMYHIAYSILHDTYQAEDAVMNAFLKLLNRKQSITDPESDETKRLMIQTIRSASIDLYRKNQKRRTRESSLEETESEAAVSDDELLQVFSRNMMNDLIGDLPEKYSSVLVERYYNNLSVRETALALGLTEATVRKRQERAIKMLRSRMCRGYSREASSLDAAHGNTESRAHRGAKGSRAPHTEMEGNYAEYI